MTSPNERHTSARPPDATQAGNASNDLTWLAHRAAAILSDAFNEVSRAAGLSDLRDWLVLALISDGPERTQLEIATELGIDKTTLVTILDRLEKSDLIVRRLSARDRRVRIPEATAKGIEVKEQVAADREEAVMRRLAAIPTASHAEFHAMLCRIVEGT